MCEVIVTLFGYRFLAYECASQDGYGYIVLHWLRRFFSRFFIKPIDSKQDILYTPYRRFMKGVEMSNIQNDIFYERMHEKHWAEYVADCERTGTHPKPKDFMVWLDDKDLIPEAEEVDAY